MKLTSIVFSSHIVELGADFPLRSQARVLPLQAHARFQGAAMFFDPKRKAPWTVSLITVARFIYVIN